MSRDTNKQGITEVNPQWLSRLNSLTQELIVEVACNNKC